MAGGILDAPERRMISDVRGLPRGSPLQRGVGCRVALCLLAKSKFVFTAPGGRAIMMTYDLVGIDHFAQGEVCVMKKLIAAALTLLLLIGITPGAYAAEPANNDSYFESHDFEQYTFTLRDAAGIGMPFQTRTYSKKKTKTMGTVTARWAKVKFSKGIKASPKIYVPSGSKAVSVTIKDKAIASKFNNVDGYEWRGIHMELSLRDGNAKKYGWNIWWTALDYYKGTNYEKNIKTKGKYNYSTFTVTKDGEEYTKCRMISWYTNVKKNGKVYGQIYVFVRVPVGYDGVTVGLLNAVGRGNSFDTSKSSAMKLYSRGGIIFRLSDEHRDSDPMYKREQTLTSKEIKTWYKSTCSSIAYKTLARNPDKYEGCRIKFTGYVLQVCSESGGWGFNEYRVATNGRYGDVIYVRIRGKLSTRILEGDKVTFWGEYEGLTTYTTIMNSRVTIPEMTAEYYTIK